MGFDLKSVLGVPFKYGGRSRQGMDCYGVVREFFKQEHGVEIEDCATYEEIIADGTRDIFEEVRTDVWQEIDGEPKPGDVVTFVHDPALKAATHCGVLLPDGRLLHAAERHGVVTTDMRWLKAKIRKVYRRCRT